MFNNFKPTESIEPTKEETAVRGKNLQIGSGETGLRADERGLWFKSLAPSDSPLHMDMEGNIHIRATEKGGGSLIWYDENGVARIFIGFEE